MLILIFILGIINCDKGLSPDTNTANRLALVLDGDNDYVLFESSIFPFTPDDFTVSLWFYVDSSAGNPTEVLFNGLYQELEIGIDRKSDTLHCGIKMNDGYHFLYTDYKLNEWMFVTIVYDKNSELFKCYKNGTLFATEDLTGLSPHSASTAGLGAYTLSMSIEPMFNGKIYELRVWSITRLQTQIQATMNDTLGYQYYTITDSGLVGYWPLNGNSIDKTLNNNHAILKSDANFEKIN